MGHDEIPKWAKIYMRCPNCNGLGFIQPQSTGTDGRCKTCSGVCVVIDSNATMQVLHRFSKVIKPAQDLCSSNTPKARLDAETALRTGLDDIT